MDVKQNLNKEINLQTEIKWGTFGKVILILFIAGYLLISLFIGFVYVTLRTFDNPGSLMLESCEKIHGEPYMVRADTDLFSCGFPFKSSQYKYDKVDKFSTFKLVERNNIVLVIDLVSNIVSALVVILSPIFIGVFIYKKLKQRRSIGGEN